MHALAMHNSVPVLIWFVWLVDCRLWSRCLSCSIVSSAVWTPSLRTLYNTLKRTILEWPASRLPWRTSHSDGTASSNRWRISPKWWVSQNWKESYKRTCIGSVNTHWVRLSNSLQINGDVPQFLFKIMIGRDKKSCDRVLKCGIFLNSKGSFAHGPQ